MSYAGVILRLILTFVLGAALAPPAHSGEPRAPTEKWVVDFADAQCIASRNYGTSDRPLLLAFKQPAVGDVMQVAVVRNGGGGRYAQQVSAKIGVDGFKPLDRTMASFSIKKLGRRVLTVNMPLTEFAMLRTARFLSIDAGSELREAFQLADIGPLMKVMDNCVADLRKVWNVNSTAGGELSKPASGSLQGIIASSDYPGIALTENREGTVQFVILIDERGKVADCTVTNTSGVAALDAQSCAIVKERARFKPAIGSDGKPAKASFQQTITWRLD